MCIDEDIEKVRNDVFGVRCRTYMYIAPEGDTVNSLASGWNGSG